MNAANELQKYSGGNKVRNFKAIKWVLCASSSVLAVMAAQTASAQTSVTDEVIVTATKRAQSVQDIPIAVTAVTPQRLEREGILDIKTLSAVAPGFSVQSTQTETQGTSIRIRGVGTTGNNIGLESAVGVFIDGAYQSRPGIVLGELVDIEQIEVLRGPQGTLFGRNTTAGALVIRTKAPELDEFNGSFSATYGNFDLKTIQAVVNAPIIENELGIRLSGAFRERDGFFISAENGDESYTKDRFLIRGQALWEPNDVTSFRLIADYQETDEQCCDSAVLASSPNFSDAQTALSFPQGVVISNAERAANGIGEVGSEFSGEVPLVGPSQLYESIVEQWGISGEFVHDFGPAELTVIGSYRDFFGISNQGDGNAQSLFDAGGNSPFRNSPDFFDEIITFTAEARLQGTSFNDKLDWLIGGYYADEDVTELFSTTLGSDFQTIVSEGALGDPTFLATITSVGNLLAGDGTFSPIAATGAFGDNLFTQNGESLSIFTHNIFNITEDFNVTVGARYVDDSKDGRFEQLDASNPACLSTFGAAGRLAGAGGPADAAAALATLEGVVGPAGAAGLLTPLGPGLPNALGLGAAFSCFPFTTPATPPGLGGGLLPETFDNTFEDDEFIYTLQAGWKPNSDILVYAGFTHGYKAGGFNLDSSAGIGGADPRFNSEEVDAFELGLKSTLLDGRLKANITGFFSDISDFQVVEFNGVGFETFNVDDVTSKGIEVELQGQWTDYISTITNINYVDSAYGDGCADNVPGAAQLCGFQLTNSPKWVGILGATYDGPLSDTDWSFLANANLRYESDRRTGVGNPVRLGTQDENIKINGRIGFTTPSDQYSIEFWGTNLTNEITRGITFNSALVGVPALGSEGISAFVEEPRTYGVTVRGKF